MSSSNRTQLCSVIEVTPGVTPATPRMRLRRVTGEGLKWTPTFEDSAEIRPDMSNAPPIKVGEDSVGDIKFELSYPVADSPADADIQGALYNPWTNTPTFFNDGTADSVVTDAGTAANTYAVSAGGTTVKVGHLVRATGFTNAANNQIFKAASSTATTIVGAGLTLTAETAPPGTAQLKVVGFQGASADITATATGLASTALDFTTLGLAAGQWIKIGGTATGDKFATAVLNDWARVTTIAAHALTLDNLPSGWMTDVGTGKTIKVWFGDQIKNGTTQISQTIEKGFLGQTVPTYIAQPGMCVSEYSMDWTAKKTITGSATFMGMKGAGQGPTPLDASPDPATALTSYPVMACSANVGRIGEAGATLTAPNFVKAFTVKIGHTTTASEDIATMGAAALTGHSFDISGTLNTFFGDNTLLTKYFAGTLTSLNVRAVKNSMGIILSIPAATYNSDGSPNAGGKDQDVAISFGWKASKDEVVTNSMITFDRIPYFEV